MSETKDEITAEQYAIAADGLTELAQRLEIEAAAFAMVNCREAALRTEELLERADGLRTVAKLLGSHRHED